MIQIYIHEIDVLNSVLNFSWNGILSGMRLGEAIRTDPKTMCSKEIELRVQNMINIIRHNI